MFAASSDFTSQSLPLKAYEPTLEIRDRKSRSVFIEAPYTVETGEAERIAVDWTAKGGEGDNSCELPFNSYHGRTSTTVKCNPISTRKGLR